MNYGPVYRPAPNHTISDQCARRNRYALHNAANCHTHPFIADYLNERIESLETQLLNLHSEEHPEGNTGLQARNEAETVIAAIFGGLEITVKDGKYYATYEKPKAYKTATAEKEG